MFCMDVNRLLVSRENLSFKNSVQENICNQPGSHQATAVGYTRNKRSPVNQMP